MKHPYYEVHGYVVGISHEECADMGAQVKKNLFVRTGPRDARAIVCPVLQKTTFYFLYPQQHIVATSKFAYQ
jgi:hypothetical protein